MNPLKRVSFLMEDGTKYEVEMQEDEAGGHDAMHILRKPYRAVSTSLSPMDVNELKLVAEALIDKITAGTQD